jgi:hypothetical protein
VAQEHSGGPPSSRPGEQAPESHHSRALKLLLQPLSSRSQPQVLDLGPALGKNVTFFSRYSAKLYIADLYRTLRSDREAGGHEGQRLDRALRDHLPHGEGPRFNLVLMWDLLDYFQPAEIEILGRHLRRLSHPGAQLFAMVSTLKLIPDRPRSYQIADPETLIYGPASSPRRPSPRYKEPDLQRMLPGLEVEVSYLLRNGVQEYVLAEPSRPPAPAAAD